MAIQDVTIEYDSVKLDALKYYMGKQNSTVEEELSDYLNRLYHNHVPVKVREFLQRGDGQEEAPRGQNEADSVRQTWASSHESAASDRQVTRPRRARRHAQDVQNEPAAAEVTAVHPADGQTENEPHAAQGMGMSMGM
jgi:hypothetical protein